MPFAFVLEARAAVDLDLELEGLDDLAFDADDFEREAPDDRDAVVFFDADVRDDELLAVFGDEAFDLVLEAARDDFEPAAFDVLDLVERDFVDEAREAGFFEPDFDELVLLLEDFLATGITFPPFSWNRPKAFCNRDTTFRGWFSVTRKTFVVSIPCTFVSTTGLMFSNQTFL